MANDAAGLGNSGGTAPNANKVDFQGKLALFRYYKTQAFDPAEVTKNFNALSLQNGAVANLNGSFIDQDSPSPTTTWSVESTQPTGLNVTFANASSLNTTATFTQAGTYILKLTVDDGFYQISDLVTITVENTPPAAYTAWVAAGGFTNAFTDTALSSNPDGDSRNNLLEFAFGTDPTSTDIGPLATDGSRPGDPVIKEASGGCFEFYFIRRTDSSLTYTPRFSSDLTTFYDNAAPVVVVPSSLNPGYQLVKVSYPSSLPNSQPARFGRLKLEANP